MSGPYAAGLGRKKRKVQSSEESDFFSSSEASMPIPTPSTRKRRRVTHADAEIIPKFRPEDTASNISSWLHKIDQLGEIYGWDTTERQFVMQLRLRGSARRWYDELDDYNLDWEGWKHALEIAFPRTTDFADKLDVMLARTKEDSETMTKYYHDKVSLLKKCNIAGEDAISCIIRGLPVELRANAKAYQCQTPEQLYFGYLSSLENYRRTGATMSLRKSTWRRGATDEVSRAASQHTGVKRCYICRRVGHEVKDCRAQQRCDTCQRSGHTSASCWFAATAEPTRQQAYVPLELAAATPTQRNWRGILIALLVIAAVLGLIVFSIALLTPAGDGGRVRGRRPTLHDVLGEHYKPFNGTWLTDEELVFRDRWGGLTLFNVKNFTTRLLMNNSTFRELNAVDFKVSADLKFVLLISDVRPGWRHARLARYHVYDVINRNKIPVSPIEDDRSAPLIQYAEWSPVGATLVFVHDNDIYYKPKVFKTLVCRITNNGIPGVIFNGVPDFLYETEVLRLDKALWFSPDGQTLMYVTYNASLVQPHKYPWYGLDLQKPPAYPTIRALRYPKVNTNNPVVTVNVVSVKTPKYLFSHAIQFNSQVDDSWYVRWTGWTSEKQLAVLLLNRPQNVSLISVCSAVHYNCQDIYRDESDGSRWSGLGSEPVEDDCGWCGGMALVGHKATVYTTMPVADAPPAGAGGWWRHAVRLTQDTRTTLSLGSYEVTQLMGWDERRRFLYVIGTAPEKAGERHLYRVKVPTDPASWPDSPVCLTCPGTDLLPPDATAEPVSDDPEFENATSALPAWPTSTVLPHVADENDTLPTDCLYNRILFSKNYSYYVQECLGPGPPATFVVSHWGARRAVLWDGAPLARQFAALAQPQVKDFRVEVQAYRAARVRLLLPPGFRETDDLPLPLVLHVSAQPGGQLVTERWKPSWGWYLAAARNFIVAEIDARGSGGQGEELRTEIYHKLLSVDVEDQIAVLSYLRDNLKMVDGSRVGVWGRGYGGGAAAALAAGDVRNVTRCLAAVAPLTDLRHHNSYWTERYSGYGSTWAGTLGVNAVWRKAGNLPPRRVLLAHAAADLTAPPHHALALARALIRNTALYTHQVYPDEGHSFERSTIHLHKTMEQFFDECFGPVEVADWDTGGVGGLFPFRD